MGESVRKAVIGREVGQRVANEWTPAVVGNECSGRAVVTTTGAMKHTIESYHGRSDDQGQGEINDIGTQAKCTMGNFEN